MNILFVCHGNICRSPMAEYIMKHIVQQAGLESHFDIASAATSTEEIGNPVYPPARRKLAEHGIKCDGHSARQLTARDYAHYDLIIGMDNYNLRNMTRICNGDPEGKIHLLLDYIDDTTQTIHPEVAHHRDVADPWYTGNFNATWNDCMQGCTALLEKISSKYLHNSK